MLRTLALCPKCYDGSIDVLLKKEKVVLRCTRFLFCPFEQQFPATWEDL